MELIGVVTDILLYVILMGRGLYMLAKGDFNVGISLLTLGCILVAVGR